MSLTLAASLIAASAAAPAITAEYGGEKFNNLGVRWNRYDFVLTNSSGEAQDVSACPSDVEIAIEDHRRLSERAFGLGFAGEGWSYDCTSYTVPAQGSVTFSAYFDEWWPYNTGVISRRRSKQIEARTSAGTFTMRFTPGPERGEKLVQVSSRR